MGNSRSDQGRLCAGMAAGTGVYASTLGIGLFLRTSLPRCRRWPFLAEHSRSRGPRPFRLALALAVAIESAVDVCRVRSGHVVVGLVDGSDHGDRLDPVFIVSKRLGPAASRVCRRR